MKFLELEFLQGINILLYNPKPPVPTNEEIAGAIFLGGLCGIGVFLIFALGYEIYDRTIRKKPEDKKNSGLPFALVLLKKEKEEDLNAEDNDETIDETN